MAPPIDYQRNTPFPASAVTNSTTTVVSTRRKQKWAPQQTYSHTSESHHSCLQQCNRVADSLIGIQLLLAAVQPSCWFDYRRVCTVPVMSAWQQTTPRFISGLAKLPGKTEDYACLKTWAPLRLRSKQTQSGILRNGRRDRTNRKHCPSHEIWSYKREGRWWGWSFDRDPTVWDKSRTSKVSGGLVNFSVY